MRKIVWLVAATIVVPPAVAPAHAAENSVRTGFDVVSRPMGDGTYLDVAECHAVAVPAPGWVPVLTSVSCAIGDSGERTISAPGAVAGTPQVNLRTVPPVALCISATAVFTAVAGPPVTVTVPEVCNVIVA